MLLTPRFVLRPMTREVVNAVLARDWSTVQQLLGAPFPPEWRDAGWHWLAPMTAPGVEGERQVEWGNRLVLARSPDHPGGDGPVLAEAGFHGPPDPSGWVEIGYQVVAASRRRGIAEEAASGLIAWAQGRGVEGVEARIAPDNEPSRRLAAKLGFTLCGTAHHAELGEQLVYRRRLAP